MRYIKGLDQYCDPARTALTMGKFDGLHRGHQELISQIRKYSGQEDVKSVVFAFDMHPLYERLRRQEDFLLTNEERERLLDGKTDYLVECPFSEDIMKMEAEDFIKNVIVHTFHAKYVVVGTDFHFGYNKRGDCHMLEKYAGVYGYHLDVIEKLTHEGREISSTYIKEAIKAGNRELADYLLGYSYEELKNRNER